MPQKVEEPSCSDGTETGKCASFYTRKSEKKKRFLYQNTSSYIIIMKLAISNISAVCMVTYFKENSFEDYVLVISLLIDKHEA